MAFILRRVQCPRAAELVHIFFRKGLVAYGHITNFSADIFAYCSSNCVLCRTSQDGRSPNFFGCPLARQLWCHSGCGWVPSSLRALIELLRKKYSKEMGVRASRIIRDIESISNTYMFWFRSPAPILQMIWSN
jgi:hypothetical protein